MHIKDRSVDRLLRRAITKILRSGISISPTKGPSREIIGTTFELTDPLQRLSRAESRNVLSSCLGETIWYLSASDRSADIEYYIKNYRKFSNDGDYIYGAYGPRIFHRFGFDQLEYVIAKLTKNPNSRNALIQIYEPIDSINTVGGSPCTCTLQFLIRQKKLHLVCFMRSNDIFRGFPHDAFCFTFIQEYVCRRLNAKLGHYFHHVGSLHLYEKNLARAEEYVSEGWQSTAPMPSMPKDNPKDNLKFLIASASAIQKGNDLEPATSLIPPYWADLIRVLRIHRCIRDELSADATTTRIEDISREFFDDYYLNFAQERARRIQQKSAIQTMDLFQDNANESK